MERLSIDEAISQLKYMYKTCMNEKCKHKGQCDLCCESKDMAIQALEEIQQYRAIGTVEELIKTQIREKVLNVELESYKEIGTIEEFKALKEKSVEKKVNIEQWIDTKCSCGYVFSKHHGDGYHSIPYENKTEHCPRCGQKLGWE